MSALFFDISISLDGYLAGPDPTLDDPLGKGGEALHDWALAAMSWRESHGREGGETGPDSDVIQETIDRAGAYLMGRNMFSGGFTEGWDDDPRANGWWGDEPPFRKPVFVLSHHAREPLTLGATTFTFVPDGPEAALALACDAAGDRDVQIAGGGDTIRQYLRLGAIDDFQLHLAPVLLGGGTRLLDGIAGRFRLDRVAQGAVPHLRYRSVSSSPA